MTDSAVTPTLDELTARAKAQFAEITELDDAKAKIDEAYEMTKAAKVINLGTTLNQIKHTLPHGRFRPWLAANFGSSNATAARYMKCAELAKVAPVQHFNYSQLVQLLPLSSDELPAFLAAMEHNGISAAGLSKRALGEYVKYWRKSKSLPVPNPPVTIDVIADSSAVAVEDMDDGTITVTGANANVTTEIVGKFVPVQPPPPRYEQLSLFANLPALPAPPRYELPAEIVDAAAEMDTPIFLIERRHDAGTDFAEPVILVVTSPLARWVDSLRTKATATITTRLPMIRAGLVRVKPALILYTGDDLDDFAQAFAKFGGVDTPYKPKSSAASNSEALW